MAQTTPITPEKLSATRKRYAEEATKRLRPDGPAQFLQLTESDEARLRTLADDPWVDHVALNARPSPIADGGTYRFFVLGAGFGGLHFAVRLLEEGVAKNADEIRLVDAAGGFGGTWYWNRFPGLHCDVESYVYLPLLEETGYVPRQKYASGLEIREYAERIAERWDLVDKTLFRTDVRGVAWDERAQLWSIESVEQRGRGLAEAPIQRTFRAQYVYLAAGVLTRPQVPKIPGLLSFEGSLFHTARWNYTVSGGSQEDQRLTRLKGKRVAVVGTAATAIAVIPEVAKYAAELYVVQRTPAYVKPRGQHATDGDTFRARVASEKGWQFKRQINLNKWLTDSAAPGEANLVNDGWTDMPAYSAVLGSPRHGIVDPSLENLEKHADAFHALDLPHMESIRARIDQIVRDQETAEKLKPWYPSWCKRPTFSDTYLQTFNRPNVHLVDTDGKGPSRITQNSLVVDDKEYPVDIIIFSTGYRVPSRDHASPAARTGVRVLGRGGQSLEDKWNAHGAATLHGYATNGFPNLFFSGTNQATITGNNVFMLGLIAAHITYWISEAERRVGAGKRAILEVTREAEEAHTAEVLRRAPYFSVLAGCTPGYFNAHGEVATITDPAEKQKRTRGVVWSEGTVSFLEYIGKWRDEGSLKGISVEAARAIKALL
ncbi:flavin-containing monooxygenase [Aspergillus lucknowensis]|uniref:FAD/NAD(P)-binding domain-containing protein n=1 Tax=Aspergillus lucknowensis TaxID=176173 RepID=A0ABR4L8G5_9EURO